MGRPKTINTDLPKYVDFVHGAYYYRGKDRRRVHLGRDRRVALSKYRRLMEGSAETALRGEMFVYVVCAVGSEGPVKIGIAKDVKKRLAGLQTSHHEHLQIRATYLFERRRAKEIEGMALSLFEEKRLRGEWLNVEVRDITAWIEHAFCAEALAIFRPRFGHATQV